jgi:hypothetical protein
MRPKWGRFYAVTVWKWLNNCQLVRLLDWLSGLRSIICYGFNVVFFLIWKENWPWNWVNITLEKFLSKKNTWWYSDTLRLLGFSSRGVSVVGHSMPCLKLFGYWRCFMGWYKPTYYWVWNVMECLRTLRMVSLAGISKGGYTLVTLPCTVTPYHDSVDGTLDHVMYQKLVVR